MQLYCAFKKHLIYCISRYNLNVEERNAIF